MGKTSGFGKAETCLVGLWRRIYHFFIRLTSAGKKAVGRSGVKGRLKRNIKMEEITKKAVGKHRISTKTAAVRLDNLFFWV
jgi:hypothetical protein